MGGGDVLLRNETYFFGGGLERCAMQFAAIIKGR
jgi:hypothetical protein